MFQISCNCLDQRCFRDCFNWCQNHLMSVFEDILSIYLCTFPFFLLYYFKHFCFSICCFFLRCLKRWISIKITTLLSENTVLYIYIYIRNMREYFSKCTHIYMYIYISHADSTDSSLSLSLSLSLFLSLSQQNLTISLSIPIIYPSCQFGYTVFGFYIEQIYTNLYWSVRTSVSMCMSL